MDNEAELRQVLDILWCNPVAKERRRLEREVVEAAKAMRKAEREADEGRNTLIRTDALIDFGKQREQLNAALDALIEFESSQQQATSAPPVE